MYFIDQSGANACGGGPCNDPSSYTLTVPWQANVQNGNPCISNAAGLSTVQGRFGNANFNLSAPYSQGVVSQRIGSTGVISRAISTGASSITLGYAATANTARANAAAITATASDNAFHSIIQSVSLTAGASALVVDGAATTGTIATTAYSNQTIMLMSDSGGVNSVPMYMCEAYIINTNIGSGGALQLNVKNFWGTP
jgi:hypothetical protein